MAKTSEVLILFQPRLLSAKSITRLLILFAVCVLSKPAEAEKSVYAFEPNQSTVIKTGGFAGVNEIYYITGRFQLNVNSDTGVASFETVDAALADVTGSAYHHSLNEIFNMTGLAGTVVDVTIVKFQGQTTDGTQSDVRMRLTLRDGSARLTGKITPPSNSADLFFYELDALVTRRYGGGTGEPNNPFLIYTAEHMNTIGTEPNDWDMHFKLMANIDLSEYKGTDFNIIGIGFANPFTGLFDGNGHTISSFSYTSAGKPYIGVFGCVGLPLNKGEIRDLGLLDSAVDAGAGECVGLLAGSLHDGTIANCYCENFSVSGGNKVGGLLGDNGGQVIACYAAGDVSCVGGMWYGGVGGLVGFNSNTITDCYAASKVTGNSTVGGLLGMNSGHVVNCYSRSTVSGTENIGGLVGMEWGGTIRGSFWDISTGGQALRDDGRGRTTAEMQTASTFLKAGWDFVRESANGTKEIWSICEGTNYPRLVWQIVPGDFVCPDGITTDDFLFFLEHWLDNNCNSSNDYCQGTDLDRSGVVDGNDLEIFLENWSAQR